jgi:hypothetical protein
MASKKTESVKKVAPKAKAAAKTKAAPKAKAAPVKAGPRHPKARVAEAHGSKAALAQVLAKALARPDEDTGALEARLKIASNAQLLRLSRATELLKQKFGDREKLIAAIGSATKKANDKDYLAKLNRYSLPQLLDMAATSQRAARS